MGWPEWVQAMADDVVGVAGVVGVTLGGSRVRGDEVPGSDIDLGLYHRGPLDVEALNRLADGWSSTPVSIGPAGSWGPWVDTGGWLTVEQTPVDWIVRDLDRVDEAWTRAVQGRSQFHAQPGHPFGFWDASYVGELLTGQVLTDPSGELERWCDQKGYPDALARQQIDRLWEADFDLVVADKGVARGDQVFVQLCLTHAMMICAHALHAADRRWVTNEKGLVPGVGRLSSAPAGFVHDAEAIVEGAGGNGDPRERADRARALVARVREHLGHLTR